jgi:DNA-directed RNA polymerase I, II, and III subunit RPABC3
MEGEWGGTNVLFEDTFRIQTVDKEGKKFQKVSRIEAQTELYEVQIALDVHSELYPIEEAEYHSVVLAGSLSLEGAEDKGVYTLHESNQNSLLNKCDYCMYGKVFRHQMEKGLLLVFISFGGLLMSLLGQPSDLHQIEPGSNVYLLMRKL